MIYGNMFADGYKFPHFMMYPPGVSFIQANITARSDSYLAIPNDGRYYDGRFTTFGIYHAVLNIAKKWDLFFATPKAKAIGDTKALLDEMFGADVIPMEALSNLHDLRYLPVKISAIPEGEKVPIKVPHIMVESTHKDFVWVAMFIETLLSSSVWKPCTVATIAAALKTMALKFSRTTCETDAFVPYQFCDFSMRGLSNPEDSIPVGAAHLTSFMGTDSSPALKFVMDYYTNTNDEGESCRYGCSALATEHSIMMMWMAIKGEKDTILTLLKKFPNGILSLVMDTKDYWNVLTNILPDPEVKQAILNRNGKTVIRPDSGDPLKIICGDPESGDDAARKGTLVLLEETFGSRINSKGYREINPKIGVIYGDSINFARGESILSTMVGMRYASNNITFGVGSFTYQYMTRDSLGVAMKPTYFEITDSNGIVKGYNLLKDPKTDNGVKKSATGLLLVEKIDGEFFLRQKVTREQIQNSYANKTNAMVTYFYNSEFPAVWVNPELRNLYKIRSKIDAYAHIFL